MTNGSVEHGTNGIDEITKIRAEVKQEIQDAQVATDSAQKQQELAQRALQGLKDAETAAKEAVVADKQGRLNDKREEGKKALRSLIRAAEVAKAGILVVSQAKNQAFLANLAEKSLTISTASAIEYGLKDYIFGNKEITLSGSGQPRSEFEKAYDNLKMVDPIAAELVSESLVKAAHDGQLGILETEAKKKFLAEEEPSKESKSEPTNRSVEDQSKKLASQYKLVNNSIRTWIQTVPFESNLRDKIERELTASCRDEIQGGKMSLQDLQNRINNEITLKVDELRGNLSSAYGKISSALTVEDRAKGAIEFLSRAKKLVNDGLIPPEELGELREKINELLKIHEANDALFEDQSHDQSRGSMVRMAEAYGISFNDSRKEVLQGIEDIDSFRKLIERRFRLSNGEVDFGKLYSEIKDVFDDVLSVIDYKPHEFFDQAFNPMYEGHFYNILLRKVRSLGEEISKDPELSKKRVSIKEVEFAPEKSQTNEGAKQRMAYFKTVEKELAYGIGEYLVNRMVKLQSITEYLHNTEVICELGMGFKQLMEYSERLSTEDVDWLFSEDEDLSTAYNLYIRSLLDELGLNMHVVPSDFGKKDSSNLDFTQRRAYYQMLSMIEKNGNDESMKRKMKRKIRMVSGITKGATGEFWGVLLASRMPLTFEIVKEYDKKLGKEVDRYKVKPTFTGTHHGGYEKMIGQLDLDLIFERFGNPAFLDTIRYTFIPRDLDKYGGAYKDPYIHTEVYKRREEAEDAFFSGRSDSLAKFDEKNVFLNEYLRAKGIDIMLRGGWRYLEYQAFIEYDKSKTDYSIIDLNKTLDNFKKIGLFAFKDFIDKIVDPKDKILIEKLDSKVIEHFIDIDKKKKFSELTDKEKKDFRKNFKEEYYKCIFKRIIDIYPSKFISLERRRYTPKGEKFIYTELLEFLKEKFKGGSYSFRDDLIEDKVFKLFASSLGLAEKITWEERKKSGNIDDKFETADLLTDKMKAKLLDFFHYYKQDVGQIDVGQMIGKDETLSLDKLSDDYFITVLEGFSKKLIESLKMERYEGEDKKGDKVTLAERYAKLLDKSMGNLEHDIGGDDFDYSKFLMQQGGKRVLSRIMGETNSLAEKINPAFKKLIVDGIPEFVKGHYGSIRDLEEAITKLLAAPIKEITVNYIDYMGKGPGDEMALRLSIFLDRILGKDRLYRITGIGGLSESFIRRTFGTQGTLAADFFKQFIERPITELDSDGSFLLGKTIANVCDVPWDSKKIIGYKNVVKIGPWAIRKPVYDKEGYKFNFQQFKKIAGHTHLNNTIEKYIPIIGIISFLIVLAMMKLAADKNKKK